MHRIVFLTSLTAIAMTMLLQDARAATRTITILGGVSCEDWVKDKEKSRKNSYYLGSHSNLRWLLGYATGYNVALDGPDRLGTIDSTIVDEWTDRYCASHPNDNARQAITSLFETLATKRPRSKKNSEHLKKQ